MRLSILFGLLGCFATSTVDAGCDTEFTFYCTNEVENAYCQYTPCVSNECPSGTQEVSPTENQFTGQGPAAPGSTGTTEFNVDSENPVACSLKRDCLSTCVLTVDEDGNPIIGCKSLETPIMDDPNATEGDFFLNHEGDWDYANLCQGS